MIYYMPISQMFSTFINYNKSNLYIYSNKLLKIRYLIIYSCHVNYNNIINIIYVIANQYYLNHFCKFTKVINNYLYFYLIIFL